MKKLFGFLFIFVFLCGFVSISSLPAIAQEDEDDTDADEYYNSVSYEDREKIASDRHKDFLKSLLPDLNVCIKTAKQNLASSGDRYIDNTSLAQEAESLKDDIIASLKDEELTIGECLDYAYRYDNFIARTKEADAEQHRRAERGDLEIINDEEDMGSDEESEEY